jgi:hypothetical protein
VQVLAVLQFLVQKVSIQHMDPKPVQIVQQEHSVLHMLLLLSLVQLEHILWPQIKFLALSAQPVTVVLQLLLLLAQAPMDQLSTLTNSAPVVLTVLQDMHAQTLIHRQFLAPTVGTQVELEIYTVLNVLPVQVVQVLVQVHLHADLDTIQWLDGLNV